MKNLVFYDYKCNLFKDKLSNPKTGVNVSGTTYVASENPYIVQRQCKDNVVQSMYIDDASEIISELIYLQFEQKLFLAMRNQLLIISLSLNDIQSITLPDAILAAKWNSTQDLLCVYHENGEVVCYGINYEIMEAVPLQSGNIDDKPEESVYVGWGSAETQFQGLKKRAGKKETVETPYVCMDETPFIEWRGNSEMFVINHLTASGRKINVYNRNCELLHVSNGITGLLSLVAYRPAGNTIACVTSTNGTDLNICFIEKNCEKIVSYPLEEHVKVCDIKWSPCGEYIAIHQKSDTNEWIDLYLYTYASWLLKQRLPINQRNPLIGFNFISVLQHMLCIELFLHSGHIQYSYVKKLIKSNNYRNDRGILSIIKGKQAHFLFYKNGITPPDSVSSDYTIEERNPINAVIFDANAYSMATIDSDSNVNIYDYTELYSWVKVRNVKLRQTNLNSPIEYYRYFFGKGGNFNRIAIADNVIISETGTKTECASNIIRAEYINETGDLILLQSNSVKTPIIDFKTYIFNGELYHFYLTAIGGFLVNNFEIKGDFTSIHIHDDYLVLTVKNVPGLTYGNYLLSIELTGDALKRLCHDDDIFKYAYCRLIEQGAVIAYSISNTPIITLILPRGNSECIELRSISLLKVKRLLDDKQYKEAYDVIRFQSMGVNLMVDLNPDGFLESIQLIYTQLEGNMTFFNKLAVELKDNCTLNNEDLKLLTPKILKDKRERVMSALLTFFLRFENIHEYLPILATIQLFSKPNKVNTRDALITVSSICEGDYETHKKHIESALKAVQLYVPQELMYREALNMHDLKLAEMVAYKSTMDPKIYMKFLIKLRDSDELTRRYLISQYTKEYQFEPQFALQRFKLGHITKEQLLAFAEESKCSETIYQQINSTDAIFADISRLYALFLASKLMSKEAGLVLCKAQLYEEAADLLIKGLNWRECVATVYALDESVRGDYLKKLASALQNANRFIEAADVYIHHCNDAMSGLQCLLDAHNYVEAHQRSLKLRDEHFKERFLIPHMLNYFTELHVQVPEITANFIKMYKRLMHLREEQSRAPMIGLENDLYTDTESIMSRSTISRTSTSSRQSSRSSKKEARKFRNTREGSKYEDIALMFELHKLITETFNLCAGLKETSNLLSLLYDSKKDVHIIVVLTRLDNLQHMMIETAEKIWPPELQNPAEFESGFENLINLEMKYRSKPENMKKIDIIIF